MARGAAPAPAGPAPAGAPAPAEPAAPAVPEKYQVKNEDGTTNWEASALKQAAGYGALSQRLHSGEAPPKTAEEYTPELPTGVTMDALKGDPMFAGFLKGAHSKGMNNAQVSYILGEFTQRMALMEQQRSSPEIGEAELRKVWASNDQMTAGLNSAYRGAAAFAADADMLSRLDSKFGNDPDYLQLMARIGKELGEDKPVAGLNPVEAETLDSLMTNPAYHDAKHPQHSVIVAKARALYAKKFPGE